MLIIKSSEFIVDIRLYKDCPRCDPTIRLNLRPECNRGTLPPFINSDIMKTEKLISRMYTLSFPIRKEEHVVLMQTKYPTEVIMLGC